VDYLDEILAQGAERAAEMADQTLRLVQEQVGFLSTGKGIRR
jgi:hypothetical protein